jgi:hypothetical protein
MTCEADGPSRNRGGDHAGWACRAGRRGASGSRSLYGGLGEATTSAPLTAKGRAKIMVRLVEAQDPNQPRRDPQRWRMPHVLTTARRCRKARRISIGSAAVNLIRAGTLTRGVVVVSGIGH